VVGAKGFEPSTSWSRTRVSENLMSFRCRTYGSIALQNPPSVGTHGTHLHQAWVRSRLDQLEADLLNAWSHDPVIAFETKGTREGQKCVVLANGARNIKERRASFLVPRT